MKAITNIEKALEAHQQNKPEENYFTRFCALRDFMLTTVYPQVMQGFPGGNDHGPQHIIRVLEYLERLIGNNIDELDIYELFIAMMAILWHDVGILQGRQDHAEKSSAILQLDSNDSIVNAQDKIFIKSAVMLHSSSADIEEQCKGFAQERVVRGHKVRIRLVAALVRLADELDEDTRRAEPSVMRMANLPEKSTFYWLFCQRIDGILPEPNKKQIAFNISFQREDIDRNEIIEGVKRSFVERFIEKILKINKERKLCSGYFPDVMKYHELALTIDPLPDMGKQTPTRITIDDNSTLTSVLDQLDVTLTRPWGSNPTSRLARLIATGHKYLEALPDTAIGDATPIPDIAKAIEGEYHVKPEIVIKANKKLTIWLRATSGGGEDALKALFFGVAGLVSAQTDVDTIEVGCSDTRDALNKAVIEHVGFMKIVFDRRQIYHLMRHKELPNDFLQQLAVELVADENTPFVNWFSVPLTEFKS